MYCTKCGNELDENTLFCPKCGEKVVSNQNENQQNSIVEDSKVDDRSLEKSAKVKEMEIKGGNKFLLNPIMNTAFKTKITDDNGAITVNMVEVKTLKDKPLIDNFEFSKKDLLNITMKNKIRRSVVLYIQLIVSVICICTGALALVGILLLLLSLWVALHRVARFELKNGQNIEIYIDGKDTYNKLVNFLLMDKE